MIVISEIGPKAITVIRRTDPPVMSFLQWQVFFPTFTVGRVRVPHSNNHTNAQSQLQEDLERNHWEKK